MSFADNASLTVVADKGVSPNRSNKQLVTMVCGRLVLPQNPKLPKLVIVTNVLAGLSGPIGLENSA